MKGNDNNDDIPYSSKFFCGLKFCDSCHFALKVHFVIQQWLLIHESHKILDHGNLELYGS